MRRPPLLWLTVLAGRSTTLLKMCAQVVNESPLKAVVVGTGAPRDPCSTHKRGVTVADLDPHLLSPCKRKLDDNSSSSDSCLSSSSKSTSTGLSLLPASIFLQQSLNHLAAQEVSVGKQKNRPFTVSIEGNIGSGKSTFLKHFSSIPGVDIHQEPIKLWTNLDGHNLLGKLYEDPQRWSFIFQSYVQLTRLNIHLQHGSNSVKLIERSLQNNRYCFLESGHDNGELTGPEYTVLCEYYNLLQSKLDIGIDLIVYLRTSPEVVYGRMMKRGRTEEAGVPLEYLKQVHQYYDRWLLQGLPQRPPAPVLVLNADQDLEQLQTEYEGKRAVILGQKPL